MSHKTYTRKAFLSTLGASLLLGRLTSCTPVQGRSKTPRVAFGAHLGPAPGQTPKALAPWDLYYYEQREAQLGRRLDFCTVMESWKSGQYRPFDPGSWSPLTTQRYPVMIWTWSPIDYTFPKTAPENQALAPPAIAAGDHDAYIDAYADRVKTWGRRIIIRMMHEMNGDWMPWSPGYFPGQTASDFVAAWRHTVDRFRAQDAINVEWCWCPNSFGDGGANMGGENALANIHSLYPGHEYVDWVGIDVYNRVPKAPTLSITQLLEQGGNIYRVVRKIASGKPMMLPEYGCNETTDLGKPGFWTSIQRELPLFFPAIRAVACWDRNLDGKYRVDSTAASLRRYTLLANDPYFQGRLRNLAVS
jgi:Glycosyl hydrolase family 26